jgi:hypothetical protein
LIEKFNPRNEENYDVENLYSSIKEQNILSPLLVMETKRFLEDGRPVFKLFEGHRRLKTNLLIEKEENKKRQIPVRIFETMGEDELLMKALMLGITGKQLKTSEKSRAIVKLQNFGYDNKKIADMMQITLGNVSTLKKFEKIPLSLQKKIDDELISFTETIKLMEHVSSMQTLEKIIDQTIENKGGKIYSRDIQQLITSSEDEDIKIVKNNIEKDIKIKNVIDEDIPTMTVFSDTTDKEDYEILIDENNYIDNQVENKLNDNNNVSIEESQSENVLSNISEDDIRKMTELKTVTGSKPKLVHLIKIYDYLMNKDIQKIFKMNYDKIKILKSIIDFQEGIISKDTLCDYFIDEN